MRRVSHGAIRFALAALVAVATGSLALAASPRALPQAALAAGKPAGDIPDSAVYLRYQGRSFVVYLEPMSAPGPTKFLDISGSAGRG